MFKKGVDYLAGNVVLSLETQDNEEDSGQRLTQDSERLRTAPTIKLCASTSPSLQLQFEPGLN